MSRQLFTTNSYYFWKWADNDLPGRPVEVLAALLRGEMHAALRIFDAHPLLKKLERVAAQGRKRGEEWDWEVTPHDAPDRAHFVFATCPELDRPRDMRWRMIKHLFALDVSGCDAESGRPADFFLPKLNAFESGQSPGEVAFDIAPDDLPVLLRRISSTLPDPYALFTNRWNHFVQCVKVGHRFQVEWRENHDLADLSRFDQWAAEYPPDSSTPRQFVPAGIVHFREHHAGLREMETKAGEEELLRFSDTVRIFEAFLRGETRPAHYRWQNINHLVA